MQRRIFREVVVGKYVLKNIGIDDILTLCRKTA